MAKTVWVMIGSAMVGVASQPTRAEEDRAASLGLDAARAASITETAGPVPGHDGKFYLASADGDWRLNISGVLQFRYVATVFNTPAGGEDLVHGFERRRTRLKFDAEIGSPILKGTIQIDLNRFTGVSRLLDAYVSFEPADGIRLHAGQFPVSFTREYEVPNTRLLAMERSIISQRSLPITDGRAQGLMAEITGEAFRAKVMFNGGSESLNTTYSEQADYALAARAELRLGGAWKQFERFSAPAGTDTAVLLGAAAWIEHPTRNAFTGDVTVQHDRFTAYAGVFFSDIEVFEPEQIWGWAAHAGYAVTEKFEPYVRYEWATTDAGDPDLSVASAGFNYYFAGSAVRLVTDVSYSFEPMVSRWQLTNAGWLIDDAGEDGQVVFKAMLQILF